LPHAKSLRAIGQSLESLGIVAFVMKKDGRNYLVRSDSLPDISQLDRKKDLTEKVWDGTSSNSRHTRLLGSDGSLRYEPPYVSWLDAQGRKKRRKRLSAQATGTMKVSQLLRTVGKHLDRLEPHAFSIQWDHENVIVEYQLPNGDVAQEILPIKKVRELTVRSRYRRARRR
jgi:hypothetical protein